MSIEQYIKTDILQSRLSDNSVLIVYDGERRYHQLAKEMASENCDVIDVSEGSLATRLEAINILSKIKSTKQLLVYVPKYAPIEDEDKQKDPFALYAAAGGIFPDPERSGDKYIDICLKAKPDQSTAIRELFEKNNNPSFDVINAIGGGVNWPTLQAALNTEGAANLLFKFMTANKAVQNKLAAETSWYNEVQSLFSSTLGLSLRTKQSSWTAISDELWRFVLFSEFAFDLNEPIPSSLSDVSHC